MKFLCPNCKAKYQISDEKIAGRTLKMDCRRCSHPIVLRGNELAAEPDATASVRPSAAPSSRPAMRTRSSGSYVGPPPSSRPSSSRTALGADFRRNAGAAAAPSRPTALDQWHVAIHDVPVGPMKRVDIAQKIGAGAVNGDSLVWREGFEDWRPLRDVPELAALLRRATPPAGRAVPRVVTPAGARAVKPPASRPAEVARPATAAADSSRPTARGSVVPIGGRLGAAAVPVVDPLSEEMADDEPTRVGSSAELFAAEEELRRAEHERTSAASPVRRETSDHGATVVSAGRTSGVADEDDDEEETEASDVAEKASRDALAPAPPIATVAEEDAFDPFASSRASLPVFENAETTPTATASLVPAQPLPSSVSYAAPVADPRSPRRGLPIGAWIAIAGATAFGATLAVMVGIQLFREPPAPVGAAEPHPEDRLAVQRSLEAVPDLELDESERASADEPAGPGEPDTPTAEATARSRSSRTGSTHSERNASSSRPSPTTSPVTTHTVGSASSEPQRPQRTLDPESAARLAQFANDGAPGRAPIALANRNAPFGEDNGPAGGTELTPEQIRAVVNRERPMVQRCYETASRAAGQAPGMRLDVDVTIGGSGTVTSATARGPSFGNLSECLERTVRRWRFPATGATSRTSIPFVFQGEEQ